MSEQGSEKDPKKALNAYAKYSSLVIQMAAMVLIGAWGGKALDAYFRTTPTFTVILILAMALLALVYLFRSLLNK